MKNAQLVYLNVKRDWQLPPRSEKRVRQIERWHKILAPRLPHIAPKILDLIIDAQLKTRKELMQNIFIKRGEEKLYVTYNAVQIYKETLPVKKAMETYRTTRQRKRVTN
jgi:hypothetical protein